MAKVAPYRYRGNFGRPFLTINYYKSIIPKQSLPGSGSLMLAQYCFDALAQAWPNVAITQGIANFIAQGSAKPFANENLVSEIFRKPNPYYMVNC